MPAKKPWTSVRIRETFLKFYEQRGHKRMPSSSLVPYNDPSVFLTTAGMQQMVPYFLGLETPPAIRMASSQKCFRTVDIDSVGDARHITFFEMLGNFSVGDYFKREAIAFAWELLTKVFGLAPDRLYPTVYPTDEESIEYWIATTGFPAERIVRLEDNWWDRGPTTPGPCGPDSEIYYDRGEALGCGRPTCQPGCDCERFLEIWNLVFMQYKQDNQGNKEPLASKNIDTGMGLERLSLVLQQKATIFETDLFAPIIQKFAQLTGTTYGADPKADITLRIIADHGRALVFLAGDGVLPGNEGRGYIFRRILRRAVRYGKLLGLEHPFLGQAADTVIELMAPIYPELRERRDRIVEVLSMEEVRFRQTLNTGLELLGNALDALARVGQREVPGEDAFTLYDTHGFPFELTKEVAAERGMTVDVSGFEDAMERQRRQSRKQAGLTNAREDDLWKDLKTQLPLTIFTGYQKTEGTSRVVALLDELQLKEMVTAPQELQPPLEPRQTPMLGVILEETPMYPESGGQVGDRGWLQGPAGTFQVMDTQRPVSGLIVHWGRMTHGYLTVASPVAIQVDTARREATRKNHSATHLLHRALKDLMGESVVQQGSLVEPERLRFDFNLPRGLKKEEIEQIDHAVNMMIRANWTVNTEMLPLEQAKRTGAMALFGEKYPDPVRVVTMGTSKELCGGTHVAATGQIGLYVTMQETSNAAGIRRIEALTGETAEALLMERKRTVDTLASRLQASPDTLAQRIDQLVAELSAARKELDQVHRAAARDEARRLAETAHDQQGNLVVAASVTASDHATLLVMNDHIRDLLQARHNDRIAILLATVQDDRVTFIVTVTPALVQQGAHAGKIAQAVGERLGGKGGGRPESAQGGGRSVDLLATVVAEVPLIVADQVAASTNGKRG